MPRLSHLTDSYRRSAELARAEANQTLLPRVRARAAATADAWSEMADQQEQYETLLHEREAGVVRRKNEVFG